MDRLYKHKNTLFAMDISTEDLWLQAIDLGKSKKIDRDWFLDRGFDVSPEKWREWLCWYIVDALQMRNLL